MSSKWINVKGKVKWCKVYEPEEYSGDLRWTTNFYPFDEDEWKKLTDSGIQVQKKEDPEGGFFVKLRRPTKKLFPKNDEITKFNPPEVSGAFTVSYVNAATGEKVSSYMKSQGIEIKTVGEQKNIGNESVVILNINIYDTKQGKGHRWDGVRVLDHVEFIPQNPDTLVKTEAVVADVVVPDDKKSSKKTTPIEKEKPSVMEDMDDSIPW